MIVVKTLTYYPLQFGTGYTDSERRSVHQNSRHSSLLLVVNLRTISVGQKLEMLTTPSVFY
jgi:hypothetical protein